MSRNINAYDNAGGIAIGAAFGDITWDTEVRKDASFTHAASSADIEIETAGDYLISVDATADVSVGTARHKVTWRLMYDADGAGAGAYAEIDGTRAVSYHRQAGDGQNTVSMHRIITCAANSYIKLQGQSDDGTATILSVADGSRILIERKYV